MNTFISPTLALLVIGGLSIVLLSFGHYVSKRLIKSSNDYLYAGRNVGLALSTATLIAAWVTGNTTMAAPEQGYTIGLIGSIAFSTAGLCLVIFAPLALRIKKLMPNGYTSGDFMRVRFGSGIWKVYILLAVYYFMGFLATQAMAGGILLQALSGLDYKVGMLTIMVVCTLYTLKGGLKAILATDFLLSLLILGTLAVAAIWAYSTFGMDTIHAAVMAEKPSTFNMLTAAGLMYLGSNFLFSCGEIFHSNIWWQRIYASNVKVAAKSFVIAGVIWFAVPIVAGSLAFIAIANGYEIPQVNMVFPIVVSNVIGPLGAVLVLIIIYSALASTVSSLLTSSSNLIVQDIYRGMLRPQATDEMAARYVKYTILALSLLTVLLVWAPRDSIYKVLLLTGPAVASMTWPIAMGIYLKHTNRNAPMWAMLLGMAAGLLGYFMVSPYSAAIFSTVVSGGIMIISTRMAPDHTFEWDHLNEGDRSQGRMANLTPTHR